MAVYTTLSAAELAGLMAEYDVGALVSAKGIAEGVSNSNWLVETTGRDGHGARFILTLYEKRVDVNDLPFFMDLLDHLSQRACPVPRFIPDRNGVMLQTLSDRPACLIEFLSGVSVTEPTAPQARSAGAALGQLHKAAADFTGERPNSLGPEGWHRLTDACGAQLDDIAAYLPEVSFPTAAPVVMSIARTFWEKATAAYVFCAQGRIRSERYARHWHDLAAIARSPHFAAVMADRAVADTVARHKSCFFIEKDRDGQVIDYAAATSGHLKIVPEGEAKAALAKDYAAMLADEVMVGDALAFDELLSACAELEAKVNQAAI